MLYLNRTLKKRRAGTHSALPQEGGPALSILSLPVSERLDYLQELLSLGNTLYRWHYDAESALVETNCPYLILDRVFLRTSGMDMIRSHTAGSRMPLIISADLGLVWCAGFIFRDDTLSAIHVLGPVVTRQLPAATIRNVLHKADVSVKSITKLTRVFQSLPSLSMNDFFRHTQMLHYCLTGEKITTADIVFQNSYTEAQGSTTKTVKKDRLQVWMTEQALMRMVTEGDLHYREALNKAMAVSGGVGASSKSSLNDAKISQIVFTSLCTRAAISGGLSPEVAYSRGDSYIQDILDCRTLTDTIHIGHTMYEDFIRMVHSSRTNPSYSKQVRSCCDYIAVHIEEKITLQEIARRIGYSEYYLSRKFRDETGTGIGDYIKTAKIERAKTLLLTTNLSIQEICDRLSFGTRSFFAQTFRDIVGVPPAQFRAQNQKL